MQGRMMKWAVVPAAALALAACSDDPIVPEADQPVAEASDVIPNQYIVTLADDVHSPAEFARMEVGIDSPLADDLEMVFEYTSAMKGFTAVLSEAQVDVLRQHPNVVDIEQDRVVTIAATQTNPTWGLDRIDQRTRSLDRQYIYDASGSGVRAYIVDTGIRSSHNEFRGRMASGYTAINDGRGTGDCNGHGTHVAGTVGGTTYGVAKAVTLVPVRVLNCQGSGSLSGIVAGMDWITRNGQRPAVANMSLGSGASSSVDNAVQGTINSGVTVVVAAGNSNANACNYSPARVSAAITVGSTTSSDSRSSFSNYGQCLDVFAPGSSITSAWHTSNTATNSISGTSMASPHVAGAAALYLQGNRSASPAQVSNWVVSNATTGRISNVGSGSPNRLLYTRLGSSPDPDPDPAPCTNCTQFSGSLSGTGDGDYQPNGNYYRANTGTHYGWLRGPSNADFDLSLYRWNGSSWVVVSSATSPDSNEDLTYYGSSGYYVWRVYSYSGSGSYDLWLRTP